MPSIPVRRPLSLSVLACAALVAVAACAAASPPGAVSAVAARTVATSPPAPAVSPAAAVAAGQTLRQVWPAGADTAWAWTQDLSGAPQGLARTADGGRKWASVTPPGLARQVGGKVITGFFALGAQHAWVTYGGINNGAAQHIAATTDGGRRWTVIGREPLTTVGFSKYVYDCGLDFVTPSVGWCQAEPPYVGSEGVDLYRTTDGGR
ncbi:MAG: WD40/YVTN/BNR-like repeat-containing protein, partial [Streptosporangiaceae bacterium]